MGQLVQTDVGNVALSPAATGMGFTAIAAPPPVDPITAAIFAAMTVGSLVFGFRGGGPKKERDTAVLEAAQESFNAIWFEVSGEALNGVERTAPPGQYGAAGIGLFSESSYPNVPHGAEGNPRVDIDGARASLEQVYRQALKQFARDASKQNLGGNYRRMFGLLQRVKAARERAAVAPPGGLPAGLRNGGSNWSLLALGGLGLVALLQ